MGLGLGIGIALSIVVEADFLLYIYAAFIILVALTLLAGVMKNKRIGKNEFKGEMLCMKDVLNK